MSKTLIQPNLIAISSTYMDNNSYILINNENALIIDPSFNGQEIINALPSNINVLGVLLTHAHFDHCFDAKMLVDKWHCPVYLHSEDKDTYYKYRYDNLVGMKVADFQKDIKWFNGDKLQIGNFSLSVLHTPGHTKGSVIYKYNNWVFVGDTLFYNSYGRTDLGNSSMADLIKSLSKLWISLNDDNLILTGHNKWGLFSEIKRVNFAVKELIEK